MFLKFYFVFLWRASVDTLLIEKVSSYVLLYIRISNSLKCPILIEFEIPKV